MIRTKLETHDAFTSLQDKQVASTVKLNRPWFRETIGYHRELIPWSSYRFDTVCRRWIDLAGLPRRTDSENNQEHGNHS